MRLNPSHDGAFDLSEQGHMLPAQVSDGFQAFVLKNNQVALVVAMVFVQAETPFLAIDENVLMPAALSVDDGSYPSVIPRHTFLSHKFNKFRVEVLVWTANKVRHRYQVTYTRD